ncbi:hypothetical protein Tco_1476483 [Tanacetum coccineum]
MLSLREVMQDHQSYIRETIISSPQDDPYNVSQKKIQEEEDLSAEEFSQYEEDIKLKNILMYRKKDKKEPDSQIQTHDPLAFVSSSPSQSRQSYGSLTYNKNNNICYNPQPEIIDYPSEESDSTSQELALIL